MSKMLWDYCVKCGGRIEVGDVCYHIGEASYCSNCVKPVNTSAEIEELKSAKERLYTVCKVQESEIDKLEQAIRKAKVEGAEEFAATLKERMEESKYKVVTDTPYARACNSVVDFWVKGINDLLKETKSRA